MFIIQSMFDVATTSHNTAKYMKYNLFILCFQYLITRTKGKNENRKKLKN